MKTLSESYKRFNDGRKTFLRESKKVSQLKLVYLSSITGSTFRKMLEEKCKENNIVFIQANPELAYLKKIDDKTYNLSDGFDETHEISVSNTIILPRLTILKNSKTKNLLKEFEYRGFFIINNLESYENCENKYTTYKVLSSDGIPTPNTTVVTSNDIQRLQKKVDAVGGKFPLVCKLLDGKKGIGVFIIDSYMSLKSTFETLFKLVPNAEILLQNKIESDYDLRIHVFNKSYNRVSNNLDNYEIIGVMRRNKIDGDFRTNFSLGGTIEKFELTDEQKDLAIKTAACVKCKWCGVDMIIDKVTGENYIIEVNASPGVKGITSVSDVPPIDYIFDFFNKFKYVNNNASVLGCVESATILFDDDKHYLTNVTFDIVNGMNLIYTKSIQYKEDENKITFVVGDLVITKSVMGTLIDKNNCISYLIQTPVEFNDTTYKNIVFKVTPDEEKANQVILSNTFISLLGNCVTIDPNNSYLVTDTIE